MLPFLFLGHLLWFAFRPAVPFTPRFAPRHSYHGRHSSHLARIHIAPTCHLFLQQLLSVHLQLLSCLQIPFALAGDVVQ